MVRSIEAVPGQLHQPTDFASRPSAARAGIHEHVRLPKGIGRCSWIPGCSASARRSPRNDERGCERAVAYLNSDLWPNPPSQTVIPAKAGIHEHGMRHLGRRPCSWAPALRPGRGGGVRGRRPAQSNSCELSSPILTEPASRPSAARAGIHGHGRPPNDIGRCSWIPGCSASARRSPRNDARGVARAAVLPNADHWAIPPTRTVIPAKAGIHEHGMCQSRCRPCSWAPALRPGRNAGGGGRGPTNTLPLARQNSLGMR
jgi:hypothetical protein